MAAIIAALTAQLTALTTAAPTTPSPESYTVLNLHFTPDSTGCENLAFCLSLGFRLPQSLPEAKQWVQLMHSGRGLREEELPWHCDVDAKPHVVSLLAPNDWDISFLPPTLTVSSCLRTRRLYSPSEQRLITQSLEQLPAWERWWEAEHYEECIGSLKGRPPTNAELHRHQQVKENREKIAGWARAPMTDKGRRLSVGWEQA